MPAVPFKQLPSNIRAPLFYVEVDNSQANTGQNGQQRTLIIGQITAAGSGTATVPTMSQGLSDAAAIGGPTSMLYLLTAAYRQADNFGEVWYLPLADDPAATAATGTITITAPATVNGTLNLYIAGVKIAQPIVTTQTVAQIATALAAAINAKPNLPVTAVAAAAVVTLTAVNKGPLGNDIDVRLNYQGTRGGELTPTGMALTIVAMAGGATAPNLSLALANVASMPFDFIVFPYSDTASLNAMQVFLNDITGRWAWSAQLYGHAIGVVRGTLGTVTTLGLARNDPHTSLLGVNDSPTPPWLWAAALTGSVAVSVRADPAQPLQSIVIPGVLPPPQQSRFQLSDRNALLWSGISTFTVGDDGTVYLENLITTYQKNASNSPDNSYLQAETLFTLAYVLRRMRSVITSKYGRMKLGENGSRYAQGANVVTPNVIKADLIGTYRQMETEGYVQAGDAFKNSVIVQKNPENPNRVDVLWPGTLINQLKIFALLAQFRLQSQ